MQDRQEDPRLAWDRQQEQLRTQVVEHDDVPWQLPGGEGGSGADAHAPLRLVGGLDISFFPQAAQQDTPTQDEDNVPAAGAEQAIASLVVLTFPEMSVVYEDHDPLPLSVPYLPGYLAFREVPAFTTLLERLRHAHGDVWWPQVLLVDGCGVLHPRGLGSASHLGVVSGLPTVGVAKSLLVVDGLDRTVVEARLAALTAKARASGSAGASASESTAGAAQASLQAGEGSSGNGAGKAGGAAEQPQEVEQQQHIEGALALQQQPLQQQQLQEYGDGVLAQEQAPPEEQLARCVCSSHVVLPLVGALGRLWGAALTTHSSKKPLYVSSGHRVGLCTALRLVSLCCRHRMPEPIRQADLRGRARVREMVAAADAAAAAVATAARQQQTPQQ